MKNFFALSLFILTKNKFYIIYCECTNADIFKINLGPGQGLRICLPLEKINLSFSIGPTQWLWKCGFTFSSLLRLTRLASLYAGDKEKEKQNNEMTSDPLLHQ
jgi:hypothetical protein